MSKIHTSLDLAMTAFRVGAFGLLGVFVAETIRNISSLRRDRLENED